jgi:hypothetical protein
MLSCCPERATRKQTAGPGLAHKPCWNARSSGLSFKGLGLVNSDLGKSPDLHQAYNSHWPHWLLSLLNVIGLD